MFTRPHAVWPAALALAVFTFVLPSRAEAAPDDIEFVEHRFSVPATIDPDTSWRGMAVGDFDGDRQIDCVFRSVPVGETAGSIVFVQAPDTYQSLQLIPEEVVAHDVATWKDGGNAGTDAFVTVGPSGLHRWTIDGEGALGATLAEVGGVLNGARLVRCVGAGATVKLFVVGGDQRSVYSVTTSAGAYSAALLFRYGTTIRDIEVLDFDATGELDLAIVSASGLDLRTIAGNAIIPVIAGDGVMAAVVRHAGRATDQVAFVSFNASTGWSALQVIGAGVVDAALTLGPLAVEDIAAADFEGDGAPELVISHSSSSYQVVLDNVSAATHPTLPVYHQAYYEFAELEPISTDFDTNAATPGFADFDADGDVDMVWLCRPTARVYVARNQSTQENSRRLFPMVGPGDLPRLTIYSYSDDVRLQLSLSVPPSVDLAYDAVEVKAWGAQFGRDVEPTLLRQVTIAPSSGLGESVQVDLGFESEWQPREGDRLFLEVRPFVVDVAGEYEDTGVVTTIAIIALPAAYEAYKARFTAVYGTTGIPTFFAAFTTGSSAVPFDSGDPDPNGLPEASSSMFPAEATDAAEYLVLASEPEGGKKGGVNTGGVSSTPNIDPFDPDVPPPAPPRRPQEP